MITYRYVSNITRREKVYTLVEAYCEILEGLQVGRTAAQAYLGHLFGYFPVPTLYASLTGKYLLF